MSSRWQEESESEIPMVTYSGENADHYEEIDIAEDRLYDVRTVQDDAQTTYKPGKIGILGLFRYRTSLDSYFILLGTFFSIVMGASLPLLGIIFGRMTDVFIDVTRRGFKNVTQIKESCLNNDTNCNTPPGLHFHFASENLFFDVSLESDDMNGSSGEDDMMTIDEFLTYMGTCSMYYLFIAISAFVSSYIQSFCWEYTCERQIYSLRRIYFLQVLRQDVSWHELNSHGDLSTKLSEDIERIREGIGSKFGMVIQYLSTFVTGVIIGLYAHWMLTLCLLILLPGVYVTASYTSKLTAASVERELLKYAAASEIATETLGSIKTVAAYSAERRELKKYNTALYLGRNLAISKYISYSFSMVLVNSFTYISYGIGFWVACYLIKEGKTTPGDVFTVFFSVMMGAFTLGNVIPFYGAVMTALGAARSVLKIIDRTPMIDPYMNIGATVKNFIGHIKFEDVTFRYPSRNDVQALSNVNLEILPGSKVAIVGHSGAGKSSIVNLLMRFYDTTSGRILYDGVNIKDLKLKWLRSNIGLVSQEPILFGVSIRDNICHGSENVSPEEVVAAAKLANAHSFISKLTEGYNTLVGEKGSQLSGGQKQRIAIARAVVRQPKILLLDEATSALDYRSEKSVQKALENVMRDRTTIIIAHRLSTIKNVDKIYVLKDGCVVETGNHDELMSLKNHFYELVIAQTQENDMSKKVVKFRMRSAVISSPTSGDDDIEELSPEVEDKQDYVFEEKNESVVLRLLKLQKEEYYFVLIGLLMCSVAGSVPPAFAFLYGEIFSTFSLEGEEFENERYFWTWMFFVFGLCSGVSYGLWSFAMASASEYLIARVRSMAMSSVTIQEISWFDYSNCSPGVLVHRLARDAPIVKHISGVRLGQIMSAVASFSTALVIACLYGWKLGLVLLIIVPFLLCGSYYQVSVSRANMFRDLTHMDKAGKVASECVQNVKTVQALGREADFVREYMDLMWEPYRQSKKNASKYSIVFAFSHSITYVMYALAFKAGSVFIGYGEMQPSDVYRVFFALSFTAVAVGQTAAYLADYAKSIASSRMVLNLIDKESLANPLLIMGERPKVTGKVAFRNIKFSYPTRKNILVLDNFNLEINAGETIALVGESGCGKSTVLSLLERFYFPDKGGIFIDGKNISTFNLNHLRRQMSLVTQEPVLFNRTIRENIMYGLDSYEADKITHKEVIEAAKMANAHDFIALLPQGYDTVCGSKGSGLSGGEKQRIAIARALIRKPKILLLDEATSALDSENEKLVQEALDKAREGRTCIIIAHRLSTIETADRIAVLDSGKVVEFGPHAALLAKRGYYYNLYHGNEL